MNIWNKIKMKKMNAKFKSIGTNVQINPTNIFYSPDNISIGDDVYIGFGGLFLGYGGIKIGSGSILAHKIEILTRNHNFDSKDLKSIPYDERYILKSVTIEENVWIGSNVLILPGVTIGEGAVIGMGSVVTKDIPKMAVVGGNPAKIIKYRDENKYYELKKTKQVYLGKKVSNKK